MEQYLITRSARPNGAVASLLTKPLSYLSSKCVLQHIEANTRLLLVSHCSSLHAQHISVPLRIEYLRIECDEVEINNFTHRFLCNFREGYSLFTRYSVRFEGKSYPIFDFTKQYNAIRKMLKKFILKRDVAVVNELRIIWCPDEKNIVKFRVKNVQILRTFPGKYVTLEDLHTIVDPKSFPVRKMLVEVENHLDPFFRKDLSAITDFLTIRILSKSDWDRWDQWDRSLVHIRNRVVKVTLMHSSISTEHLAQLAQNWTSREVGTKYGFEFFPDSSAYLKILSTEITRLTGIPAKDDVMYGEGYIFELEDGKQLKIYRTETSKKSSNGPYECCAKPSIIAILICDADPMCFISNYDADF